MDWDVRLRVSLEDFAAASRSLHTLPSGKINCSDLRPTQVMHSPYGDGWDVLWLGHCGMDIPRGGSLIIMEGDETVPEAQHLKSFEEAAASPLQPILNTPEFSWSRQKAPVRWRMLYLKRELGQS